MSVEYFGNITIGWSAVILSENNVLLSISLIGVLLHFALWFQLFLHKVLFDLSLVFSLGYLSTDFFLMLAYFVQYGIRTHGLISTSRTFCYFEAYFMLYFNILESPCLTFLNIARYWQIVHNRNVYSTHRRWILLICVIVPALIMINMIVQHSLGWCVVIEESGTSCSLAYNNIAVRVWNEIVLFALPIIINFGTCIQSILYIKHVHTQQMIIRHNHHRRLIYRFIFFYTVWLTLWGPSLFLQHLDIEAINDKGSFPLAICSTLEMTIDGILVYLLDKRFAKAWKTSCHWIIRQLTLKSNAQVQPTIEFAANTHFRTGTLTNKATPKPLPIPSA